uniref:Secreted protein n=1 Tax=Klebsiella phage HenuGS TaxID=3350566 RepID=A0AB74UL68_9CAUD
MLRVISFSLQYVLWITKSSLSRSSITFSSVRRFTSMYRSAFLSLPSQYRFVRRPPTGSLRSAERCCPPEFVASIATGVLDMYSSGHGESRAATRSSTAAKKHHGESACLKASESNGFSATERTTAIFLSTQSARSSNRVLS